MNDENATMVLKIDPEVGLYICVEREDRDFLRSYLKDTSLKFEIDPEKAVRLAEPGKRVFVFGAQHPLGVRDVLVGFDYAVEMVPELVSNEKTYRAPLDQLLCLGEPPTEGTALSYATLGIVREHVPELMRMAVDKELNEGPSESKIVWAPVHAWWALAELRAEEAVVPLLGLLSWIDEHQDEVAAEALPRVLAKIGPAGLEPIAEYMANPAHGDWARLAAAGALRWMSESHPETRPVCVAHVSGQLARFAEQSETLNASLVVVLLDLRAVEAAPVMERAFASGPVEEALCGDWEDAQIELGLKKQREHPPKPNKLSIWGEKLRSAWTSAGLPLPDKNGNFPELPPPPPEPLLLPSDRSVRPVAESQPYIAPAKVGRNDPCPCGSGKKFKKCCG